MIILDVAIGLIFVYLLLSLVCTAVTEFLAGLWGKRARTLRGGIAQILGAAESAGLTEKFYAQPLIRSLGEKPSYIPAREFTLTVLNLTGIVGTDAARARTLDEMRGAIDAARIEGVELGADLRRTLKILLDEAEGDLKRLQANVDAWYNDVMDRVSGDYKRWAQFVAFGVALFVAWFANADTLEITRTLARDEALRSALVAQAQEMAKLPLDSVRVRVSPTDTLTRKELRIEERIGRLQALGLPLGWKDAAGRPVGPVAGWKAVPDLTSKIIGLLLSAVALSLGAPFWFDMLNKVINIRAAGRAPDERAKRPERTGGDRTEPPPPPLPARP